jgi:hypothetical protein
MSPRRTLYDNVGVLNSLAFGNWSSLGSLDALFPQSVSADLSDALRDDLETIVDQNQALADPYLLRDCLYLFQRLPRLLAWREAFAEPCGAVRNPLVDREVLELRQLFPKGLTLNKRLFRDTVTELFPDLFAIDRAVAGVGWYAGQWCRDIVRAQSGILEKMIRSNSSPLDSYLPVEGLLRVIVQETTHSGTARRLAWRARRTRGRVRKRIRALSRRDSHALRPRRPTVDPAVFVLRAITLRELFRTHGSGTRS